MGLWTKFNIHSQLKNNNNKTLWDGKRKGGTDFVTKSVKIIYKCHIISINTAFFVCVCGTRKTDIEFI